MHIGSSSQVPTIAPDSPFMANLAWGAEPHLRRHALLAVQRSVHPLPEPQDRAVRRRDRLDPVLPRARRAGARQAAALGEAGREVHGPRHHRRRSRHHRHPRARSASTSSAASSTTPTASRASTRSARTTSCARPTIRTPTRRGRTASRSSRTGSSTSRPEVQYKILRGNAERLYRFTPAEPPVLANA